MRVSFASIVLLCISFVLLAQDDENKDLISRAGSYGMAIPDSNKYYIPAYKHVSIYSRPDIRSRIFYKTESFADSVRIMEVYPEKYARFKGVYGCWCKVSFPLNGKRFIGYVPSQLLGVIAVRENNTIYLALVDEYKNGTLKLSLKIIDHFQLISEHLFEPASQETYYPVEKDTSAVAMGGYLSIELLTDKGLAGIDRIVKISSGIDACGYLNGTDFLLLAQNKLVQTLSEQSIGDADIYAHGFSYSFPSDSPGQNNIVLKSMWHYESVNDLLQTPGTRRLS